MEKPEIPVGKSNGSRDSLYWEPSGQMDCSLSIRPSYGVRGEEILTSLPFSLPFFPFSPETPDTQARWTVI